MTSAPKLTNEMIYAAACAHYGKRRVDRGSVVGITMTVNGQDYNFPQAFRRMWRGAWSAAPPALSAPPAPVGGGRAAINAMATEMARAVKRVQGYSETPRAPGIVSELDSWIERNPGPWDSLRGIFVSGLTGYPAALAALSSPPLEGDQGFSSLQSPAAPYAPVEPNGSSSADGGAK